MAIRDLFRRQPTAAVVRNELLTRTTAEVPREPANPAGLTMPVCVDYGVDIVGESHYAEALERIAGGRTEDGTVRGRDELLVAALVPQPSNPYDPNAIAVEIEGELVGHLCRDDAVRLGPMIKRVIVERGAAICACNLKGGWDRGRSDRGNIGVVLRFNRPGYPTVPATQPGERRLGPSEQDLQEERWGAGVTVVAEEHYQDAIGFCVPADWGTESFPALAELAIARNPHASASTDAIEVRLATRTVGFFTAAMTQRYRSLIDAALAASLRPTARARVHRGQKGGIEIWRASVMLPSA